MGQRASSTNKYNNNHCKRSLHNKLEEKPSCLLAFCGHTNIAIFMIENHFMSLAFLGFNHTFIQKKDSLILYVLRKPRNILKQLGFKYCGSVPQCIPYTVASNLVLVLEGYLKSIKQTYIKHVYYGPHFPQRNSRKSLQGSLRFLEPDQKTTGVNDVAKPRSCPHGNLKYCG